MMKYLVLLLTSTWLTASAANSEYYYSTHPKALQQAIANCPDKHPQGIRCEQLKEAAERVNELAYQLRLDPQEYGKKILALEEEVANQETRLHDAPDDALRTSLKENKRHLQECLAIVKWLESPES